MMTTYAALRAEIAARHHSLSPRLRHIAEYALRNPADMALETIAVIAQRAKVPPSSLVRFGRAFGFSGFAAMQQVFRSELLERTNAYDDAARRLESVVALSGAEAVLDRLVDAGARALQRLRAAARPEEIERAVSLLADAEAVHVVGHWRAFAVAAYLSYAIGQLGVRTHLLEGVGGTTLHQASFMRPRDVLVAVGFEPYAAETMAVARRADELGVPIVALTDSPLSPLLGLARVGFEVVDAEVESVRSLVATMCLAMTLVVRLRQRLDARPARRSPRRVRQRQDPHPTAQPGAAAAQADGRRGDDGEQPRRGDALAAATPR